MNDLIARLALIAMRDSRVRDAVLKLIEEAARRGGSL